MSDTETTPLFAQLVAEMPEVAPLLPSSWSAGDVEQLADPADAEHQPVAEPDESGGDGAHGQT